ncbi:DUF6492 family protein [Bacillus songklensis]|uniref:DUF6492 family protein n=1 Tax=Bacillus songklensis TaxID=1069116 RepID=A0ABV8AZR0_9BACI
MAPELYQLDHSLFEFNPTPLDLVIPVLEKDLDVLPYVVNSARSKILHPIDEIYIVSPNNKLIREFCLHHSCKFIDEDTILPITKHDIDYTVPPGWKWEGITYDEPKNRSGWLFQQFIKLSGDHLCSNNYYLVLDSDTVFLQPHVFIFDNKEVLYCPDVKGTHRPIFKLLKLLLGHKAVAPVSLISHHMLFHSPKVRLLKEKIEKRFNKPWYQVILDHIDKTDIFSFSEFETYGNFLLKDFPHSIILADGKNSYMKQWEIDDIDKFDLDELSKKYKTMSFHSHSRKNSSILLDEYRPYPQ